MNTPRRRGLLKALLLLACAGCTPANEPTEQPLLVPDPSPFQYPIELWDRKVTGETVLLVRVTSDGKVDSVSVFNSSGHAQFDSAAVTGARKLRFVPGKRGQRPVETWTKLPVRFELDSAKVAG